MKKDTKQIILDDVTKGKVQKIYDTFIDTNEHLTESYTQKTKLKKYDVDKTLFCYSRVSSDIQLEGTSIEQQKEFGEKLSKQLGFDYIQYDEGSKSSNHEEIHKRPKVFEIYNLVGKKKIKHLFVSDISRLSRTTTISMMFQIQLYKNKVKLYTMKGEYDFENSEDKLLFGILSLFSQYDNDIRRTRSIMGKIHRLKQNRFIGGTINFGYDVDKNKKIVVNKEESKYVKRIFMMYDNYRSTKEIQQYLITNGVKTKKGLTVFSTESIMNILKNEIYIGRREQNVGGHIIHTKNQSIVKNDVFWRCRRRVKDILDRRNQNNKTSNFYLLRHLLYCKRCKNIMCGRTVKRNGKVSENFYYCSQSSYRWKGTKLKETKCDLKKSVNIKQSDLLVWETLCDVFENSVVLKEKMKSDVLSEKETNSKSISNKIRTLKTKLSKVDKKILDLRENIFIVEKDFYTMKKTKQQMLDITTSILDEVDRMERVQNGIVSEIEMLSSDKNWVDWINKYSKRVNYLRSITDKKKQRKHLDEFIERIDVDYDDVNKEHLLDIKLKLKLFDDKLIYKDVQNKKLGYEIKDGSNRKMLNFKRMKDVKKKRTI